CQQHNTRYYWTIHGLWLSEKDAEGHDIPKPLQCPEQTFDYKKIERIECQLANVWPSVRKEGHGGRRAFWGHEWDKHGRFCCYSQKLWGQCSYFTNAMRTLNANKIGDILQKAEITTSNTKTYKQSEIKVALETHFPANTFTLKCYKDPQTSKTLLTEVRICLNYDLKPTTCYRKTNSECDDAMYYWPYPRSTAGTAKHPKKP
ncbi:unnamed protein product, partial [Ixodes hexagonus]